MQTHRQSGNSLVELVVYLGLSALVILNYSQFLSYTRQIQASLNIPIAANNVKTYIEDRIDCSETSTRVYDSCPGSNYVALVHKRKAVTDPWENVVEAYNEALPWNATKIAGLSIRAKCVPCTKETDDGVVSNEQECTKFCTTCELYRLYLEYAEIKNNNFVIDPATGKPHSWAPLYQYYPFPCVIQG